MCKSVQSQNQPGKTGCFAQPQKLDFNGIYCAKSSSFIQTTISHDTPVLWQGLGHPNRHRLHRNEVHHEQAAFLPLLRKSDLHSRKNCVKRTVGIAFMMKEKMKIAN